MTACFAVRFVEGHVEHTLYKESTLAKKNKTQAEYVYEDKKNHHAQNMFPSAGTLKTKDTKEAIWFN